MTTAFRSIDLGRAVAAVSACCCALLVWWLASVHAEYRREQQIVDEVTRLQGKCELRYCGPAWIPEDLTNQLWLFDRIQSVEIDSPDCSPKEIAACLARRESAGHLEALSLCNQDLTLAAPHLKRLCRLKDLFLLYSTMNDSDLENLKGMEGLDYLDLSGTKVTGPGLRHLVGLTKLTYLVLRSCRIDEEHLQTLQRIPNLRYLDLCGSGISDSGLQHLASLNMLEGLLLQQSLISDSGLDHLVGLRRLRKLWLSQTSITDAGVARLASLHILEELNLSNTGISDEGLLVVGRMKNLRRVFVYVCANTTAEGRGNLQLSLPNGGVEPLP